MAAAYASYLRLARLGTSSGVNLSTLRSITCPKPTFDRTLFDHHDIRSSSSLFRQSHARFISQLVKTNGKRLHLVDTLALVNNKNPLSCPAIFNLPKGFLHCCIFKMIIVFSVFD